jgi:uncharacterized protein involved in exopolysaccharide biosynthesis
VDFPPEDDDERLLIAEAVVASRMAPVLDVLSRLVTDDDRLRGQIIAITDDLNTQLNEAFDRVNATVAALEERVARLRSEVASLNQRTVPGRLREIRVVRRDVDGDISQIEVHDPVGQPA